MHVTNVNGDTIPWKYNWLIWYSECLEKHEAVNGAAEE